MTQQQAYFMAEFAYKMLIAELGFIEVSGSDDFDDAFKLLDRIESYSVASISGVAN